MTGQIDTATERELFSLALAYAKAADRQDRTAFAACFGPNATLEVRGAGVQGGVATAHGTDEIAAAADRLARYVRTMHVVAQGLYERNDDGATGEVYCIAHHLLEMRPSEFVDRVMYIRYEDEYRQQSAWTIEKRTVNIEWIEQRPVEKVAPEEPGGDSPT